MNDYLAVIERHADALCAARFTRSKAHNSILGTDAAGKHTWHRRANFCAECRDIAVIVHDDVYRLLLV